jgi:hypothetical protein
MPVHQLPAPLPPAHREAATTDLDHGPSAREFQDAPPDAFQSYCTYVKKQESQAWLNN